MSRYDLIGDVHGYADQLCRLLKRLGYEQRASVYGHPNRAAVFLGDFVDRDDYALFGPKLQAPNSASRHQRPPRRAQTGQCVDRECAEVTQQKSPHDRLDRHRLNPCHSPIVSRKRILSASTTQPMAGCESPNDGMNRR